MESAANRRLGRLLRCTASDDSLSLLHRLPACAYRFGAAASRLRRASPYCLNHQPKNINLTLLSDCRHGQPTRTISCGGCLGLLPRATSSEYRFVRQPGSSVSRGLRLGHWPRNTSRTPTCTYRFGHRHCLRC